MSKDDAISESDLLVYGAYVRIAYSLQHSNRIQITYKSLTFTWLIAAYIGVGYTISTMEINLPLNPLLIVAIISLASLIVISLIWYLDLIVEEKKIASAVHKGLKLEEKYPDFLPKAYHNVVSMHYLLRYVSMKSIFYVGICFIFLLTICSAVSAYLYIAQSKFWFLVPPVIFIISATVFLIANFMTKKTDPYPVLEKLHIQKKTFGNRQL